MQWVYTSARDSRDIIKNYSKYSIIVQKTHHDSCARSALAISLNSIDSTSRINNMLSFITNVASRCASHTWNSGIKPKPSRSRSFRPSLTACSSKFYLSFIASLSLFVSTSILSFYSKIGFRFLLIAVFFSIFLRIHVKPLELQSQLFAHWRIGKSCFNGFNWFIQNWSQKFTLVMNRNCHECFLNFENALIRALS